MLDDDGSGGGGGEGGERDAAARRHRMPRWALREILVLIEGKRVVEGLGRGRGVRSPGAAVAGETKWAAISAYCQRNGVERGVMQCRKRWDNLTSDFKKIRAWEKGEGAASGDSYWVMRSDSRRDRKLPTYFDKEVYRILDGTAEEEVDEEVRVKSGDDGERAEGNDGEEDEEGENDEQICIQNVAEKGLFPDLNDANGIEDLQTPIAVMPLSVRKIDPSQQKFSDPGYAEISTDRHPTNGYEKQSSAQGSKRARTSPDEVENNHFHDQLIKVLERNNTMIMEQFKAQNSHFQLDSDQRREQANNLLDVLNKVTDAVGRIADKL